MPYSLVKQNAQGSRAHPNTAELQIIKVAPRRPALPSWHRKPHRPADLIKSISQSADPKRFHLNRYSCHRPHGFYPCLARAGCSARRNPRGRKLVPAHGHRYLGATRNDSGWIGFPIAPSTTMATHPQSHTLPVDVVKSVATLAHEQERLVFLSMPSQHDIAQTDRPISQSFAEALHVALGHKIG